MFLTMSGYVYVAICVVLSIAIAKYFDQWNSPKIINGTLREEYFDGMTSIRRNAYKACTSLTAVSIPGSVEHIGSLAFWDCTNLIKVTIRDGMRNIGDGAFGLCANLTEVSIPRSVKSIGNMAFYNCTNLIKVTIRDGMRSIGDGAFGFCTNLTEVSIPRSVKSIGWGAFAGCSSLASIVIPDSVTSIGDHAFRVCSSLASIAIPDSVMSIGDQAFLGCSSLVSIVIPDSVKSIGDQAFWGCSSLVSIVIPDSVKSIGNYAFSGCIRLTQVNIPEGCDISIHAFQECDALETIVISENDRDRLSAPGIFPKPLHQYNIIIKKPGKPVKYHVDRYKTKDIEAYKEKAIEVYKTAKVSGLTPVMVRFIIPVQLYPLNIVGKLVPLEIKQELRALVLLFNRLEIPNVTKVQTCRFIISKQGIKMSRELDYKFESNSDDPVIANISNNLNTVRENI